MSTITPENIAAAAARIKAAPHGRWLPMFQVEAERLLGNATTQTSAEHELREIWRQLDPRGEIPTEQRERIFANAKEKARANGATRGTANGRDNGIIPLEAKDSLRVFDWRNEANGGGQQEKPKGDETHPNTSGTAGTGTTPPPSRLVWLDMSKWDTEPTPKRQWVIRNRVPLNQAGLFSGEGGTGKSIIELQKDVAHVAGKDWFGSLPEQGPAFYFGAEDGVDEIHIRLAVIANHFCLTFKELIDGGLYVLPLLGQDATLCYVTGKSGKIETTPLYKELYERAGDIKPKNISIDTLSRAFAGNEIDRVHVYGFASHMQALAMVANGAVTILSHPSVQGTNSGSGLSGSTAWHGAFRFRQYLHGIKGKDGEQPYADVRELEFKKNQYGPLGESIAIRYVAEKGMFLPVQGTSGIEKLRSEADAEDVFLKCLDDLAKRGRRVGINSGTNYAPAIFAETTLGKTVGNSALKTAMGRLFEKGEIIIGPNPDVKPSRANQVILRKTE